MSGLEYPREPVGTGLGSGEVAFVGQEKEFGFYFKCDGKPCKEALFVFKMGDP